ncbi:MAG: isocitrate lyase/phosphoenolpyruvate mutase family protein [Rhizobiales bacterium]|nr:isocitrate lyase/phosphoenolpyruvate mutase family protein [Hyphomicrobiales bacterium]
MNFAQQFKNLHIKGNPVILFNIWDAGTAKIVEKSGAKAIATGSAPVAYANGFADGEVMPLDLVIANIKRICLATNLPLTVDLEGGYGADVNIVAETVSRAIEAGAIGFNFEDQIVGTTQLYDIALQSDRIKAARKAATNGAFLNSRTDLFLKAAPQAHNDELLNASIERAKAYEQAGADGFFAPGLADEQLIKRLCEQSPIPVNILALPNVPKIKTLAKLGVSRVSYGPIPYRKMASWFEQIAKEALHQG